MSLLHSYLTKNVHVGIHSEAIGHFIRETEILDYLITGDGMLDNRKNFTLCAQKRISNRFFLRLLSYSYGIKLWPHGSYAMRSLNRISKSHRLENERLKERNQKHLNKIHAQKSALLTPEVEREIQEHLFRHLNDLPFQNYVIFAIRDFGYDFRTFRKIDIRDQEYRHTPMSSFLPVFEFLNSQGLGIIRVGRHNNTSISRTYPPGIEISNISCENPDLCDFAIFSGAKSVFSTGTGVDDIGLFLRKPTYYINVAPFGNVPDSPTIKGSLASEYFDSSGSRLGLSEIVNRNLHTKRPNEAIKRGELLIKPKNPKVMLEFVSHFQTLNQKEDDSVTVHELAGKGLGQTWRKVLY